MQLLKKIFCSKKGERGMTLVETLVALSILGVSATAFILALSTGTIATRAQEEDAIAQGLAQAQLEQIKAEAYDPSGTAYTHLSPPAGYGIAVSVDSSLYSNNHIQKIAVTISSEGNPLWTLEGYKVDR